MAQLSIVVGDGKKMAIWQFRLNLIPEEVLLRRYEILPSVIPEDLAEDLPWWSDVQPPSGFERQIDLILPQMKSWSESMRMWGTKGSDDAHVGYVDESEKVVEDIQFRVDARTISPDLVRRICILAKYLGCALMTSDYEILAPDESMVLSAINNSIAKKFVDDPVSTLKSLDRPDIQKKFNRSIKDLEGPPPSE